MPQSTLTLQPPSKSLPQSAIWQPSRVASSPDLKLTFLLPIAVDQPTWISQSTVPISSSGSQMEHYQVQSNVQAHRKVGAQWVVAPLEPVRASTFLFRDSPPLLTCAFHQTRCTLYLRAWFLPRFDLRCSGKRRGPNTLCKRPRTLPHHQWGDRPHAEPERVEPTVQGRADAPEPVRRAARLTRCKDRHATGEPQVLRRVLNHPHRQVGARAGAR